MHSDPPHVDVVTSTAVDNEGNTATDNDDAVVDLTDVLPTITVDKTVAPGTRPEPGGTFRFTAVVRNTSPEPVTITTLVDDRFGSLTDPANPLVSNSTCLNAVGTQLAADPDGAGPQLGGAYTCAFDAQVIGQAEDPPHVDVVTAVAVDNEGNVATDDDDATVLLTDVLPLIDVNKSVSPGSLPEPGGTFRFSVVVTNSGPDAVVITSLVDDRFGNLDDPANPLVSNSTCLTGVGTRLLPDPDGAGPQPPGTFSCAFDARVTGDASDPAHVDVVTAIAVDDEGNEVTADDDASVDLTDLLPIINVVKTADPTSIPEPGGEVQFTVVVRNVGPDALTITELNDDVFGNLDNPANPLVTESTCLTAVGTELEADPDGAGPVLGGSFTCTFLAEVAGDATDPPHVDTVTVDGEDSEGNPTTDSDDATVTFTETPPTVLVVKTAAPETRPAPGGTFTFTVVVTNTSSENVTITSLTDDIYGNIATQGTCRDAIGTVLGPDETYSCTFDGNFGGPGSQTDIVTVIVTDDDDQTATDDGDAIVTVTPTPPSEVNQQNLVQTPTTPTAETPTSTATQTQSTLPKTGAGVTDLVALAAGLVAIGTLMLLGGSRWGQGASLAAASGAASVRTIWSRRRAT